MVELCELKMMSKDVDYWPADIDQHVAQLEFDTSSSMMIEQSMFASSTAGGVDITDPERDNDIDDEEDEADEEEEEGVATNQLDMEELAAAAAAAGIDSSIVISTDSLDMDLIRDCSGNAKNRNDYKLIFEDSGQWTTTSGIGASMTTNSNGSPPMRRIGTNSGSCRQQQPVVSTPSYKQPQQHYAESSLASGRMLDRHFGLRLLEQLNNDAWTEAIGEASEEEKHKIIDKLLSTVVNDDDGVANNPMTTWGRIQDADPYEAKTYSMQNVCTEHDDYSTGGGIHGATRGPENGSKLPESTRRPFSCGDMKYPKRVPANSTALNTSNNSEGSSHSTSSRTSLLANFVEHQQARQNWRNENCRVPMGNNGEEVAGNGGYEYNETYLGDGRYIDLNENQIGYVPESTASIQRSSQSGSNHNSNNNSQHQHPADDWQPPAGRQTAMAAGGQMRPNVTHIDLPPSFTAPDLKFLSLTHKTPSFCRSQISLDEMLRRARNGSLLLSENLFSDEKVAMLADAFCPASTQEQMSLFERHNAQPDSGIGSSSSSGPAHIEDWPSLAVLLPNSLLTGSSASGSLNNIERKMSAAGSSNAATNAGTEYDAGACRTCFNVRRRRLHPPPWAHKSSKDSVPPSPIGAMKAPLCDCISCCCCCASMPQTMSEIAQAPQRDRSSSRHRLSNSASTTTATASALTARIPKLNAAELSVVGLPLYNAKRTLVERVVEGVAEIARGASAVVLYSALTRLLTDGLLEDHRPWAVIVAVTGNGPATNNIFNLVKRLEASEKPENSRIDHFFKELLSLHSLEGWLSYVVLKENVLMRMYADTAFLLRANSAYRSLFWRLIESIELLSVLSQCSRHRAQRRHNNATANISSSCYVTKEWEGASRLPSDSRIPKSSSIPEKLTPNPSAQASTETSYKTPNVQAVEESIPSTSAPISFVDVAAKGVTQCATLPRNKSSTQKRRASRIPIASPTAARSMTNCGTLSSGPSSTLRTRSLHSRTTTPALVARVRERVTENDANTGTSRLLLLEKGERVRVLSIREDMSRCCRMHLRFGAPLNGVVPTQKLDFC